ncbi:hypothetical protein PFFVO_01268 [Plasmodium falciparum Vietnam Oak-Knoll (FVO)]|uniref:Uncharacterized protein n=1 Tax=Plasmodium falciparum Vietnam Oak-Knoll (FVO) TaxID=1036723 RepID=A0A024V9V3_PLAFA|nr:hypothetical protein PFFVO_01268 [Plasmodium falciparum Vietnam Oak-Knoll (FVO)]
MIIQIWFSTNNKEIYPVFIKWLVISPDSFMQNEEKKKKKKKKDDVKLLYRMKYRTFFDISNEKKKLRKFKHIY